MKAKTLFHKDSRLKSGQCSRCTECTSIRDRTLYNKKRRARLRQITAYAKTERGVAARLRVKHGFDKSSSEHWAKILVNSKSRCMICGIPLHKLRRMLTFMCGSEKTNRRLSIDHITPSVNDGNYRPLCFSCNSIRSDAHFTDEEVLTKMQDWYMYRFSIRKLWWMNTHHNPKTGLCEGGREERTPRMEQKIADLLEDDDEGIESTG